MDLIQIVEYGLRANGYDGLFVEDRCSCKIDDLAPYGCLADGCRPGVLIDIELCGNCTREHPCDFHIGPKPNTECEALSDESGADAFTPLRRTAGNLRICAAVLPNYAASTAGVMIGFASEIEAWVQDHERTVHAQARSAAEGR